MHARMCSSTHSVPAVQAIFLGATAAFGVCVLVAAPLIAAQRLKRVLRDDVDTV
jgi:hypothetical protein